MKAKEIIKWFETNSLDNEDDDIRICREDFNELKEKCNQDTKKAPQDYDKEEDIMSVHWGENTEHSGEFFDGKLILDFDKDDNIVGLEMFDFMKEVKKGQIRLDKMFSNQNKNAPEEHFKDKLLRILNKMFEESKELKYDFTEEEANWQKAQKLELENIINIINDLDESNQILKPTNEVKVSNQNKSEGDKNEQRR